MILYVQNYKDSTDKKKILLEVIKNTQQNYRIQNQLTKSVA